MTKGGREANAGWATIVKAAARFHRLDEVDKTAGGKRRGVSGTSNGGSMDLTVTADDDVRWCVEMCS